MSISIVIATTNRVHLLRRCVENVLARTSEETREIVIWNNASTDSTAEYLSRLRLRDPRVRVVDSPRNITTNAYEMGFRLTTGDYLVGLDDDVLDAPLEWDKRLMEAYRALPDVGYLAANLANNVHDVTSQIMYGRHAHLYRSVEINGVRLKLGPTGAWCSMTSRDVYDRVGGFPLERKLRFFYHDGEYIERIKRIGLRAALLEDLEVVHGGGVFYAPIPDVKMEFWLRRRRQIARKDLVKRVLLALPLARRTNQRFHLFEPPPQRG